MSLLDVPYRQVGSSDIFELIIFPTEKCNFRCTYCYEKFDIGKMKSEVRAGVKNLISKRVSSLKDFHISWFGGEPLVALDVMREIGKFSHAICDENSCKFTSSATTNGYLLDINVARELAGLGLREYQITLDGPEEIHDGFRQQKDGSGSFRRIMSNLIAIKNSDLQCLVKLRLHISPDNFQAMREFISYLESELDFKNDSRFSPYLHPICKWGGPNDSELSVFKKNDFDQVVVELERALGNVDDDPSPYICYAAKANSFVIRADGRIGKCTVALYDDKNTIGQLNPDGTMKVDGDLLKPWISGILDNDIEKMACPYSHMN